MLKKMSQTLNLIFLKEKETDCTPKMITRPMRGKDVFVILDGLSSCGLVTVATKRFVPIPVHPLLSSSYRDTRETL